MHVKFETQKMEWIFQFSFILKYHQNMSNVIFNFITRKKICFLDNSCNPYVEL